MFSPKKEYMYETEKIPLIKFHLYKDNFILRPPYQRKANIWSSEKRLNFLDSVCRGYYIPAIVLREVRFDGDAKRYEVLDGQQRITTIMMFFDNELRLPGTLSDMPKGNSLADKFHDGLDPGLREWFDELYLEADVIKNIDSRTEGEHLRKAADIFWRLQLGEPLTQMEIQHARVYSAVRNFVTKYADDQCFDYKNYRLLDSNPNRHPFFDRTLSMTNKRMQHLLLLSRLLMLELDDGPTDLSIDNISKLFGKFNVESVDDKSFEDKPETKHCLKLLTKFHDIFKNDVMARGGSSVKELKTEYFVTSMYLLLRHLDTYYVFTEKEYPMFKDFVIEFYQQWKKRNAKDTDVMTFRDHHRQEKEDVEMRDQVLREVFSRKHPDILTKDARRTFNEAERISVYRKDRGLCQMCLKEGKPEIEALVPWSQYQTDHIVAHMKGGSTTPVNAQVLCQHHNAQKGAK